ANTARLTVCVGAIAVLLMTGLSPAWAILQPNRPELPNFDKRPRGAANEAEADESRRAALARLTSRLNNSVNVDWDEVIGSPAWIRATNGFLSGPNAEGGAISAETARKRGADEPHRAVKAFIAEHKELFGHGPEALDTAIVAREFVTAHNG